ncbi:MAG: signal peptidase I [Pirellulales bacterium]
MTRGEPLISNHSSLAPNIENKMTKKNKNRRSEAFPQEKGSSNQDKSQNNKEVDGDTLTVVREFIESVVIAIVLALLFRAFEAEAFVIPTGSMAPTLMGRHKDVIDEETGFEFRVGSSSEVNDHGKVVSNITQTLDPIYRTRVDIKENPSFTGDRILVSKFAYDFADPKRWDVIVFKNPSAPQINYIKRLIGLPGETIKIYHGDIYVKKSGESEFTIARKPPHKQLELLQDVYDSNHQNQKLLAAGFPERLENYPLTSTAWTKQDADKPVYECQKSGTEINWLRYRHALPEYRELQAAKQGRKINAQNARETLSQLITDFNVYNANGYSGMDGDHWVGDLAVECQCVVKSESGELHLDLVEGGRHFRCLIDVSSGKATLKVIGDGVQLKDADSDGTLSAKTSIQGAGTYDLRFANCDDQLRLWVNNSLIDFGSDATFTSPKKLPPLWSEIDPGDLLPVGIGSKGLDAAVSDIQVFRDLYYISFKRLRTGNDSTELTDYDYGSTISNSRDVFNLMKAPGRWSTTSIFDNRREVEFKLEQGQYFPMGDNSSSSLDGRLWEEGQQYVPRRLLIGKALLVYWPHSTNKPFPLFPNFRRMRFIR